MSNDEYWKPINPNDFQKFSNDSIKKRHDDITNVLTRIFEEEIKKEKKELRLKKINKINDRNK
jgi:hypothetical protein